MSKAIREAFVREIWATSASIPGTASQLGITPQLLYNMAHRLGLQRRKKTQSEAA